MHVDKYTIAHRKVVVVAQSCWSKKRKQLRTIPHPCRHKVHSEVCWIVVLAICLRSVFLGCSGAGIQLHIGMLCAHFRACLVMQVIPDGAYEQYVERVLDSSRYWVLKIVRWPMVRFQLKRFAILSVVGLRWMANGMPSSVSASVIASLAILEGWKMVNYLSFAERCYDEKLNTLAVVECLWQIGQAIVFFFHFPTLQGDVKYLQ